jgi:hypothetical protein
MSYPVDRDLLDRASELLVDIENQGRAEWETVLESLKCVANRLWPSVAKSSQYHRSILALIESLLTQISNLESGQASALRGAFSDLRILKLGEAQVNAVRSSFVDAGFRPLAFLGPEVNDDDGQSD